MLKISKVKRLAAEGTSGNWSASNGKLVRVNAINDGHVTCVCGVHKIGSMGGEVVGNAWANAQRIASTPSLEKAVIAAEDMANALEAIARSADSPDGMASDIARAALHKYRQHVALDDNPTPPSSDGSML